MAFQQQVRNLAIKFHQKLKRHYYVTPTSYLELIQTYKTLLASKRKLMDTVRRRCDAPLLLFADIVSDNLPCNSYFSFSFVQQQVHRQYGAALLSCRCAALHHCCQYVASINQY